MQLSQTLQAKLSLHGLFAINLLFLILSSCVVVPASETVYDAKCGISTDRKVLRMVDLIDETNSYYSISGFMLSSITIPTTAVASSIYVATQDIFFIDDKKIRCRKDENLQQLEKAPEENSNY